MTSSIAQQTGSALIWKGLQIGSTKGVLVIRLIILARLLTPDDFGVVAIATVSLGLLMTVTDFGMIPALVQQHGAKQEHFDAAWTISLIRAAMVGTVVFLAAPLIATIFGDARATDLIRVLAITPLLDALASIKIAQLTRDLHFRPLALARLSEALINTTIAIALAKSLGPWALIAGQIAGSCTYLVASYIAAPYRPRLSLNAAAALPLIRFGRWMFVIGIIAVTGSSLLQLTVARTTGTEGLGLYVLAAKLAFLPAEFAREGFGAIAFPLFARLQSDLAQSRRAFQALLVSMALLIVPTCVLIITLAPSLVTYLLGPQWEGTAALICILACVNVVGLLGDVVVPMLKGAGEPYKIAALEIVQSGLLLALVGALGSLWGVIGAALAWLPAIGISQLLSLYFVHKLLPQPLSGLAPRIGAIGAMAGVGAIVALGVDYMLPGIVGILVAALLALGSMVALLWLLDRQLRLGFTVDLPRVFPQVAKMVGFAPVKP
jgi:O-antigen/teichoic acid export membrane protein